jgi:hypothetical protein
MSSRRTLLLGSLLFLAMLAGLLWSSLGGAPPGEARSVAGPGGTDAGAPGSSWRRLAGRTDLDPELVAVLGELNERLGSLAEAHASLIDAQAALETQLVALRNALPAEALLLDPATGAEDTADAPPGTAGGARRAGFRGRRGATPEPDRLMEAGFSAFEARRIVQRVDELALERLELRYRAAREGWLNTPEYREQAGELPDTRELLESEFGQDGYDRYLYASGRPNRVIVDDVIHGSVAEAAGLQPGDVLLQMADRRIYGTRDLMRIGTQSSSQSPVPLTVERGGSLVQVYVPPGPLGVRTERGFENPAPD